MKWLALWWNNHKQKTLGILMVVSGYLYEHTDTIHQFIHNNDAAGKIISTCGLLVAICGFLAPKTSQS